MNDPIDRQEAIDALCDNCDNVQAVCAHYPCKQYIAVEKLPSVWREIIRCEDCIYGYLFVDVRNGVTDSWIECRNPEGLNRDVSVDGYCSAAIRRSEDG